MPLLIVPPQGAPVVVSGGVGSPDLVASSAADPCPRTEITVTVTGTQSVTVWRTTDGQRSKVRGADNVPSQGAFFVVDHETPLARTVSYTVALDGGPEGPASTVVIPQDYAWIQDPMDPTLAAPVGWLGGVAAPAAGALGSLTYPMPAALVPILGSAYPVALGGTRQAAQRVPFGLFCEFAEGTSLVRAVLTEAFPVLLRPLPTWPALPPVAFCSVTEPVESPINGLRGGTMTSWTLVFDLVAAPAVSIVVPIWTYGDVSALWATYGSASATGRTYLDFYRSPEP